MNTITNPTSSEISSIRALARALNVSHTTVAEWLRRADWPYPTTPPWPAMMLPEIEEWRDELQADRNLVQRRVRQELIGPKEAFSIRPSELTDPACPLYVGKYIGPSLIADCTVAHLDYLSRVLTCVFFYAMIDVAEKRGEPGIRKEAPRAYWELLLKSIDDDKTSHQLQNVIENWTASVFKDREWWKELREPIEKPSAEFLAWVKKARLFDRKISGDAIAKAVERAARN